MKKPALSLYQPDIPQNVGAAMRLTACLDLDLEIIEPCGFPWDDRKIRQSAMDYGLLARFCRHESWDRFLTAMKGRRIILMTTKADRIYTDFEFAPDDVLLAGRESAGVPAEIHKAADARLGIPMAPAARSLNIVTASAIVLGEALRQINLPTSS